MDSNTLFGIAGLLIGLVGIAVAVYEGRMYRGPTLAYQYDGFNLIRSYDAIFPESIEVVFGGQPVKNLTHSQIVIWNNGRGPITGRELSLQDPLIVKFGENFHILQAEITKITNIANSVGINYNQYDAFIAINFEFLDSSDGFLFSVWHTNPNPIPRISGTLINKKAGPFGLGRFIGPRPNVPDRVYKRDFFQRIMNTSGIILRLPVFFSIFMMLLGSIPMAAVIFRWISQYFKIHEFFGVYNIFSKNSDILADLAIFFFGLIYFSGGSAIWRQYRRKFPKILLPDEYRSELR